MLGKRNYLQNCKMDAHLPQGLLNGQGIGTLSQYRYGLFSFGWCGCEVIAAYNLLQMAGKPEPLSEITREIYRRGHVLLGFFGTNVYTMAHFLKKRGIPVRTIYRKQTFLENPGAYGVISFWTKPKRVLTCSIHTVAYSTRADGGVEVYNRFNSHDYAHEYADMREAFGKYPFIVANAVGEKNT